MKHTTFLGLYTLYSQLSWNIIDCDRRNSIDNSASLKAILLLEKISQLDALSAESRANLHILIDNTLSKSNRERQWCIKFLPKPFYKVVYGYFSGRTELFSLLILVELHVCPSEAPYLRILNFGNLSIQEKLI